MCLKHSFCDQQSLLLVEEREVWGRCREKLVLLSVEVLMVYNISFERDRPVEDSAVKGFAATAGGCVATDVVWTLFATSFLPEC